MTKYIVYYQTHTSEVDCNDIVNIHGLYNTKIEAMKAALNLRTSLINIASEDNTKINLERVGDNTYFETDKTRTLVIISTVEEK